MSPMKERLSNRIRRHRTAAELSQADLARRVGVSRQTVVAMEKGNYNPSVALALRLARALGTTVEELFTLEADHVR